MWKSLGTLVAGYARALGSIFQSLWHSLSGRGSLLFSLFFVMLLAGLFFVGTEPGRVSLTRGAFHLSERLLPDLHIRAGELGSARLGHWSFSSLAIEYNEESLLQAREVVIDVRLGELTRKRINIEQLTAAELRFDNDILTQLLQAGSDAVAPEEEVAEPSGPLSLPAIRVGRLRIDRLQVVDSRVADLPVFSLNLDGRYDWPGEVTGIRLDLKGLDGADLQLALSGDELDSGRFSLQLNVREKPGGFAGNYLQLPSGQALDARAKIEVWRPDENQLRLELRELALPLVAHQFSLSGGASLQLSPWQVSSDGLLLQVDDTRHQISGSVSDDSLAADIQFNRLPIAISQPWQDFLVGGWLTADLSVGGSLASPRVQGIVDLRSHFREQPLVLQGRVQTRGQVIELPSASLEYVDTRLNASGSVDIAAESLDLKGEIVQLTVDDIRRLLAVLPGTEAIEIPEDLQGSVERLQAEAKGPWKNPQLLVNLEASPEYRQLAARLSARVQGDLRQLELPEFSLESDNLDISGAGTVSLEKESLQLQLDVSADNFRPGEQLGLVAAEDLALDLEAAVGVSGPWKNPQIDSRIRSEGVYREYRYRLNGAAAGDLQKIVLDRMRLELDVDAARPEGGEQLRGPQSLITRRRRDRDPATRQSAARVGALAEEARQLGQQGSAWLEVSGEIEPQAARARGTVAARNIPISLAELAGIDLPPSLEGQLSIDGDFSGPFTKPEASANVLATGRFRSEPWHLQGDVGYGSGLLQLSQVELVWAGRNQLSADGSLNQNQLDLEIRGRGRLIDLDLGLPADVAERGEVTLWATASGSPQQPNLEGALELSGTAAGAQQPLQLKLDWRTEGDYLRALLGAQHANRQAIDARVELAIAPILEQIFAQRPAGAEAPPLPLQLDSSGTADLSVVAEFIDPEIHAMRGQLNFTVNADGTFAEPNLEGQIRLEGGRYEHRPSNTRLRNIEFLARLTPSEWRIERARADDGEKGTISLAGAMSLVPGAAPVLDFQLNAKRAQLLNSPAVRGAFSGTLALTGTAEDALLEGRLTLRPLTVQVEQMFGSSVPEIEVVEVEVDGPQTERARPLLDKIALAVEVVLDQQSYVRGLGLDSELRGNVDVTGTAAKPSASGTLRIVRGKFDLLGKRFDLQEGVVQFENSEAAIYVKGKYEYSEGEIIAEISGTSDDLDVNFSSTPAAAQDEIFAQLLFGKSMSDISPLQAVRLVTVIRTLQSGGSAFDPVARTRELLGVDTLDVQTEDTEEGDQYSLSLGKYITNRIYIELLRSTDPLTPWRAKMQIELGRNLNLQFKSADESESGAGSVELQWKNDY